MTISHQRQGDDDAKSMEDEDVCESFSVLGERELDGDVSIAAWSPTSDLFATVAAMPPSTATTSSAKPSSSSVLRMHHMDLRILWSEPQDRAPTALAFRPDGRVLAVGHADGRIAIVDVETREDAAAGSQQCAPSAGAASIALLSWHDARGWGRRPDDDEAADGGHGIGVLGVGLARSRRRERRHPPFPILCSCDAALRVRVSAFGLIPLCEIDVLASTPALQNPLGAAGCRPAAMACDHDLTSIAVVFTAAAASPPPAPSPPSASQEVGDARVMAARIDLGALTPRVRSAVGRWARDAAATEAAVGSIRADLRKMRHQVNALERKFPHCQSHARGESLP